MKAARIVVFGIAAAAGLAAWMLSGTREQAPVEVAQAPLSTVDVLVAATDIQMGSPVRPEDVRWQAWPQDAANPAYVKKTDTPNAIQDTSGSIARSPFVSGEPIRPDKLIKGNGSGYMAAILPAGMRAISIEISAETGAGGFILPNDRVDVILTRKPTDGGLAFSETLDRNVRVLAIDQMVEDKDGQKVVIGKTATLELSPEQTEQIAQARQQGTLSLALRALVDSGPNESLEAPRPETKGSVTIVRYGYATRGGGN